MKHFVIITVALLVAAYAAYADRAVIYGTLIMFRERVHPDQKDGGYYDLFMIKTSQPVEIKTEDENGEPTIASSRKIQVICKDPG
jgi:hypothetical protein